MTFEKRQKLKKRHDDPDFGLILSDQGYRDDSILFGTVFRQWEDFMERKRERDAARDLQWDLLREYILSRSHNPEGFAPREGFLRNNIRRNPAIGSDMMTSSWTQKGLLTSYMYAEIAEDEKKMKRKQKIVEILSAPKTVGSGCLDQKSFIPKKIQHKQFNHKIPSKQKLPRQKQCNFRFN